MPEKTRNEFARSISLLDTKVWVYFMAVFVNSIVIAYGFNMVLAFIKKNVLDAAMLGQQGLLARALLLAAVTFFLGTPLWLISQYGIALITKRLMTRSRVQMFEQIVRLPAKYFEDQHSGDLISRSTNDINIIERIFEQLVPGLIFGLILGVVGIIMILAMDWRLGLLALGVGFLIVLVSTKMAGPLRERSENIQQSMGALTERLTDLLQGVQVTKMFHLEQETHQLYVAANEIWATAKVRQASLQAVFDSVNVFLEWMRSLGTLALGLFFLSQGYGTLGTIVAAIHLQSNAGFMFSNLGDFITHIQASLAGAGRVFDVMDSSTEPKYQLAPASEAQSQQPTVSPIIEMQDLAFSYNGDNDTDRLLRQISLKVFPGHLAALVGPSGGGKSTLIKLLLGIYPIEAGQILIKGKSIGVYPLAELREKVAYVPQDAYLFDGTVEENIRYGNMNATDDEVIAAAKAAYAHGFILQQPDGYQTIVGERGTHLSGGQRQRIAIARALLKNAPILLLDEATSALDSESEQLVQRALETLMQGRTTIAVAHRLSTIQHADTIYVIDKGLIVEQGTHAELLKEKGLYQTLYAMQFEMSAA